MTKSATKSFLKGSLLLSVGVSTLAISSAAMAQTATGDEIIVTGTRQVIQDAIQLKRQETSIVDGLSASEIGDIPALSIGEALQTLTSVAAQREGSGVTEVSIRGLGTFLGSTVINGREATNGSGNRSVNFSQFPSELFNKIAIQKTQEASLIEGGVAGQIQLSTLKPLEYNKRRIQIQAKANVQPDNLNINNNARDVGHRLTGSYVDQFDFGDGQRLGISIGGQTRQTPIAEQEARSTSGFSSCLIADFDNGSCDSSGNRAQDVDPATGDRFGLTEPFVIESSTRSFRQQTTDDSRDSVFGSVQWQPNDRVDISFDGQYSERTFIEERNDILVDANDFPAVGSTTVIPGFEILTASDGSLRRGTTTGNVEHNSFFQERSEEYLGLGANVSFDVTDRLNISIDASHSKTDRQEDQIQARLRSESSITAGIEVLQNGSDAHQFTLVNFDVTDPNAFNGDDANDFRVREDLNQLVDYEIQAIRGDLSYDVNESIFTELKAGARYSTQDFSAIPRVRRETDGNDEEFADTFNGEAIDFSTFGGIVANACANGSFPESDFLNGEINGNLFTNIDSDGNVIDAGTGNAFFTTSPLCLAEAFLGRTPEVPSAEDILTNGGLGVVDFQEDTIAAYLQAEFETSFDGLPVRGNVGARIVNTQIDSTGLRSDLTVERDADGFITDVTTGELEEDVATNEYTEILPSLNLIVDVREDLLLRGAVFRGLSRPSPRELGFGRTFIVDDVDDAGVTDVGAFISDVSANGNPFIDPFLSWNFDTAVEWYPNPDTIFAVGVYYKVFDGDQETISQPETFVVDGESFTVPVEIRNIGEDSSKVFGFETTVSHAFDYLPGLWSGLGFKLSYNYADSDFESQDGTFGEVTTFDIDGNATTLSAIVPPANLQGLSRHTASGQVYYNIGKLDLTGLVKHRSRYFQPGNSTPTLIRQIDTATVVDARVSYKLNSNIKLSFEGSNIFNEARTQLNPTVDSLAELNVFGPRYTVGLTARF